MPTTLILIRHGATDWNQQKRYCGFVDIGLSKLGKAQARLLKKRLAAQKFHKIYCSDRKRAIETAKIVFGKRALEKTPELREMHFGIFEGLTHSEILEKHGEVYKKWLRMPHRICIPKGEGLRIFKERVKKGFKKIVSQNPGKTVAVVCHGGTISIFATHLLGLKNFWKHIPSSASLSIIEYEGRKHKVVALNDTSHLPKKK